MSIGVMSGLERNNPRDVTFTTIINQILEDENLDNLAPFAEKLHQEAVEFLKEEIGLEDFEEPDKRLSWERTLPLIDRTGGDHLGVYRDRDDLAAVKLDVSFNTPFSSAVHEFIHSDQYKRILNLNFGGLTAQEIIDEADLAEDFYRAEDVEAEYGSSGAEGTVYTPSPLVEDLISEKNLSNSEIAKALHNDRYARRKLQELNEEYENTVESGHERFVRELEEAADGGEADEFSLGDTKQAQEIIEKSYDLVVDALEEAHAKEFYSPRISAEQEGFAHYISEFIEGGSAPRADFLEDNYERGIDGETTVGEIAAERLRELNDIHSNLVEYGDMRDEEAARFILTEVQPRKFEYASKVS